MATNAFAETRSLFVEYLQYTSPLPHHVWSQLRLDDQVAVLYVQFYSAIVSAWRKTQSFYTLEEDGVSCILQYLQKNAPIIQEDARRFTGAYIYRVAFNCLYCICHDLAAPRAIYQNEISDQVCTSDGEYVSLFDSIAAVDSSMDTCASFGTQVDTIREQFWALVETQPTAVVRIFDKLAKGEPLSPTQAAKAAVLMPTWQKLFAEYRAYFQD